MAFENVFRNVDFGQIARARHADANRLQQMIGQGIAAYERGVDRDIKHRQLEAKAQEFNLEKAAKEALYNKAQGLPYDQNAIQAYSDLKGEQTYVDQFGRVITTPSLVDRVGLDGMARDESGAFHGVRAPVAPTAQRDAAIAAQSDVTQVTPVLGDDVIDRVEVAPPAAPFKVRGEMAGTPAAEKMEQQVSADIYKERLREQRNKYNLQKYNDSQLIAANFANRMDESTKLIESLTPKAKEARTGWLGRMAQVLDILPLGEFGTMTGEAILHSNISPEQQQYMNAARNWITANLRKESGAAIPPSELTAEYEKYFPVAGDSGAVIEQKAQLRKVAERGMIGQSAGSYQIMYGKKAQAMDEKNKQSGAIDYRSYFQ